jgi:hypothetical protein
MISIKDNTELIYYEAFSTNIWKYQSSTNLWTNIKQRAMPRNSFDVIPVQGLACS